MRDIIDTRSSFAAQLGAGVAFWIFLAVMA